MSNLIQIKRSQTTAQPSSLANGEMAFTAAGNVVFIGNYGQVLAIAGQRTPGILTANQALVANSTGWINSVQATNVYTYSITANGSIGSSGSVLAVNSTGGVYWSSTAAVNPSYVQNTDSRVLSGNLTFTGANVIISGANTAITNLNVTNINRSPDITLTGDIVGSGTMNNLGDVTITTSLTAGAVNLNTGTTGDYVQDLYAANGIGVASGTGHGSSPYVTVIASNGITVNSSGVSANVDGTTVSLVGGAIAVNTVPLGSHTSGDYVKDLYVANGISISSGTGAGSTPTIGVQLVSGGGLLANASGIYINPSAPISYSGITVTGASTLNGNVVLGSNNTTYIDFLGVVNSSIIPATTNTYNLGAYNEIWNTLYSSYIQTNAAQIYGDNVSNTVYVGGLNINQGLNANTGSFYGNVTIGGSLTISGNVTYVNVATFQTNDPLVFFASNNTVSDIVDIGFAADYYDGTTLRHTGLARHASNKDYYLFQNTTQDLTSNNTVNISDASFQLANLHTYLVSGGLVSSTGAVTITANSTLNVSITANTLSLTSPLPSSSGGTGYSSYVNGDLLVGNTSTSNIMKLTLGSSGYVLQSDGTNLVYGTLDGGTF